jgi:S-adenosylmethionine:tRNA ribosyltransferase-isomerase
VSAPTFALPRELEAGEPPERRGLARDEVRLMVVRRERGEIAHAAFRDLPELLDPGDLLVINVSATLPAAVPARLAGGHEAELHFAGPAPGTKGTTGTAKGTTGTVPSVPWWVVEPRSPDGVDPWSGPDPRGPAELPGGALAAIAAPYAGSGRLWLARVRVGEPVEEYLLRYGHPIRYGYGPDPQPLDAYQTAFATAPGSAEMPSAGRPFTPELVTALVARGILIAPVTLHAGVSSPERDEPPLAERYAVPAPTARLVNATRDWGGRVVAVGTTVVRALETAAGPDGTITGASGWTQEVITPRRGLGAVDGLVTGWHEPEASHLRLLETALGPELLARSYDAALARGYLWHEFGDAQLVLP